MSWRRIPVAADRNLLLATAGLAATQMIGWGTTYYLPAVIAQQLMTDIGLSRDGVFGGVAVALLTAAIVGPRTGIWIDRVGPRPMLCIGSALLAAGLALLSASRSPSMYYAAWIAIGLGVPAALSIAAHALLARIAPSTAKRSIGTLMLFTGLSSTVFWPVSSLLLGTMSWRDMCLLFAGLHLFVCLPIHWALPQASAARRAQIEEKRGLVKAPALPWQPVPPSHQRKALYLMATVLSLQGFVSWGLPLHLISLFEGYGLSHASAVSIAALAGPAAVAARLVDMGIGSRLHPVLVATTAMLLMPWTFVLLLAMGGSALSLTVFTILWSAGNGVMAVARATLPLTLFGGKEFGRIMGWLSLPQNVAFAAAPLAFSLITESTGTAGALTMGLISTALSCAAIILLAHIAGQQLRQT